MAPESKEHRQDGIASTDWVTNEKTTSSSDDTKKNGQKAEVTVNEKAVSGQHGEHALPGGWTIMRPLRMRGLKGKASAASSASAKAHGNGEANDLKNVQTNDGADGSNGVDALHEVRSDDELLRDEEAGPRNVAGQQGGLNTDGSNDIESNLSVLEFKVYKRRWFGLAQLVLLNIVVSWDWLSFSASSTTASKYFGVTPTAINWLSTTFMFAFVVASPVTIFVLHRGGPKPSIVIASVLLLLGNWIRYGASRAGPNGSFAGVMFGQILIGLAQPFVLAAPTRYSDLWFSNRGRIAATAVMSLANPFGGAIAQLIGPELAKVPGDIPSMVLYISIIATVACVPSFFIPDAPPTPSSASGTEEKQQLLPSIKFLFSSPEFFMIMIPFTFYVGLFNSISSLINQMLQPYSFTETEAGIAGALLIVVGLLTSAVTSPIIDKTKTYLLAIKVLVPIIALSYLAFTFAPESRSIAAPYVILAVLGAASFSLVPVVLEYLIEITHPVSPEVTSTICWSGGQLLGGIFVIVSGALREGGVNDGTADDGSSRPPGNMYKALILQAVLALVVVPLPLALGLFGRGHGIKMRRVEADRLAADRRSVVAAESSVLN